MEVLLAMHALVEQGLPVPRSPSPRRRSGRRVLLGGAQEGFHPFGDVRLLLLEGLEVLGALGPMSVLRAT